MFSLTLLLSHTLLPSLALLPSHMLPALLLANLVLASQAIFATLAGLCGRLQDEAAGLRLPKVALPSRPRMLRVNSTRALVDAVTVARSRTLAPEATRPNSEPPSG